MKDEMISVIIPVYNVEKYLEACLDSVIAQTYQDIEIILVNDGSTDSSPLICKKYAQKDARIRLIEKENGGLSDARNAGMAIASGNYYTFIDSDDIVHPSLIEHLWEILVEHDADISICDPCHCYPDTTAKFENSTKSVVYDHEQSVIEMLYQKSFLVSAWGKLIKKSLFQDIIFPKGKLFEDIAIMYKLFDHANRIVYSNAKLYGYMHRENSITTKRFDKRDCDILEVSQSIVDYYGNRGEKLLKAAKVYQTNAALRVMLNAPDNDDFKDVISNCKAIVKSNYKKIIFDKNARFKLRIGLLLVVYCRPIVPFIYKRVDRWK